jgi:GTPase SAR1 family protein
MIKNVKLSSLKNVIRRIMFESSVSNEFDTYISDYLKEVENERRDEVIKILRFKKGEMPSESEIKEEIDIQNLLETQYKQDSVLISLKNEHNSILQKISILMIRIDQNSRIKYYDVIKNIYKQIPQIVDVEPQIVDLESGSNVSSVNLSKFGNYNKFYIKTKLPRQDIKYKIGSQQKKLEDLFLELQENITNQKHRESEIINKFIVDRERKKNIELQAAAQIDDPNKTKPGIKRKP